MTRPIHGKLYGVTQHWEASCWPAHCCDETPSMAPPIITSCRSRNRCDNNFRTMHQLSSGQ